MTQYRIVSSAGIDLGTYSASSTADALDKMSRDAGYESAEHAASVAGPFDGTITELPTYRITASIDSHRTDTAEHLGAAFGKTYYSLEAAEAVAQMLREDAPDYGQEHVVYAVETC